MFPSTGPALSNPLIPVSRAIEQVNPQPDDVVAILGQGPIGLMFTMLAARTGAKIVATDTMAPRRELAQKFGAAEALDPRDEALERSIQGRHRWAGSRRGDRRRVRARHRGTSRWLLAGRGRRSCFLRKLRTRNESKFPAPTSVWRKEPFAVLTALRWTYKKSLQGWFLAGILPVEELVSHLVCR